MNYRAGCKESLCGFYPMAVTRAGSYGVFMATKGKDEPVQRSDRDFGKFEEQSPENKTLERLKDHAEKSTGPEKADLDQEIRERSGTED